jgi:lipopolysaccharide/colanic/teichoic acid biosynthesis glycosyltransferase
MSLVGPRPIVEEEAKHYNGHMVDYLSVRPGLTGLWQVSGRNDLTYERRVALDVHYIRNRSAWLDLRILARTFGVIVRGTGAY